MASLKRCPDTNFEFARLCVAAEISDLSKFANAFMELSPIV